MNEALKKVTFLELPVFSGVAPLASGLMEAYSLGDPLLANRFSFTKLSLVVNTPHDRVVSALLEADADVYGFSCYVWNMGLVRRILASLLAKKPKALFILGGPQVMHQAHRYIEPANENVYVCNGEGERTFANFLRAILNGGLSDVRGLSFYRNRELLTTPTEPRVADLSELPSPYLLDLFKKQTYTWMLIETNRGCPFKCSYCYWGAATGGRVYKHTEDRVKQEIEWISNSGAWSLFIADANWGMLERDRELSQHIVDCQKRNGAPLSVYFCGSKNTPERVSDITQIFHDAGMVATQSVALQTMDPGALSRVNRDNIKTTTYTQMQQSLNDRRISSFVEIIWPLPGESLQSFESGLATLCEIGADSFVVYPLLLMNNVELSLKKQEYGLMTIEDPDDNSEAEIVVATNEVDSASYRDGIRYVYAVMSLYALRGLWHLGSYLHTNGMRSYVDLFRSFVEYCRSHPSNPWSEFCEGSIARFEHVTYANSGAIAHLTLHSERESFDELLEEFVSTQDFWVDMNARVLFEIDLLHRPFIYRNSAIAQKVHRFEYVKILDVQENGYRVRIPFDCRHLIKSALCDGSSEWSGDAIFEVDHRRNQLSYMRAKSLHEHYIYCNDMSQRTAAFLPIWRMVSCEPAYANV